MTDADDAYANAPYIEGGAAYPARWTAAVAAFRAEQPGEVRPYGPLPRHIYEFYGGAGPTLIFVHGGNWRQTDPSVRLHLAAPVLARAGPVRCPAMTCAPTCASHGSRSRLHWRYR